MKHVLVSDSVGKEILSLPPRSFNNPIFTSTSMFPTRWAGLFFMVRWTNDATSWINSSRGSTPRIDRDRGGKVVEGMRMMMEVWDQKFMYVAV